MNQSAPLQVVGGNKFGRYPKISQEATINMMVSDGALVPYSGYIVAKEVAGTEARAIYKSVKNNVMMRIIDTRVYIVDTALNHTLVGSISTSSGDCYITENSASPTQFLITDGSFLYLYTYGVGVVNQLVSGAPNYVDFIPGFVDYQDGYFIASDKNSNQWRLSHLEDGNNWVNPDPTTGLTYQGLFQTKPDNVQAVVQFNRLLFVMAETGTELSRDVGTLLFPYQRDNQTSIDYGVISISTIATGFGILCWFAKNEKANPSIVASFGGKPEPISTDGIDYILAQLTTPEDSDAFMFQEDGHRFYQITFLTDNLTLVYDFDEQKFYTLTDENLNHHIAKSAVFFNNTNYFNAYGTADLYQYGSQFTTYANKVIPRYRVCPPIRRGDTARFKIPRVSLNMEQGQTHQLQKVGISLSTDGGMSFGNIYEVECNADGYGANQMNFYQLGSANDLTIKFQFWSAAPPVPPGETGNLADRFVIVAGEIEISL